MLITRSKSKKKTMTLKMNFDTHSHTTRFDSIKSTAEATTTTFCVFSFCLFTKDAHHDKRVWTNLALLLKIKYHFISSSLVCIVDKCPNFFFGRLFSLLAVASLCFFSSFFYDYHLSLYFECLDCLTIDYGRQRISRK